jgi:hypothetical protein
MEHMQPVHRLPVCLLGCWSASKRKSIQHILMLCSLFEQSGFKPTMSLNPARHDSLQRPLLVTMSELLTTLLDALVFIFAFALTQSLTACIYWAGQLMMQRAAILGKTVPAFCTQAPPGSVTICHLTCHTKSDRNVDDDARIYHCTTMSSEIAKL